MSVLDLAKQLNAQGNERLRQQNEIFKQAMSGNPQAQNQVMMSIPILSMSTKGAGVAKRAIELSGIAKKIHPEDLLEMADFTEYARNTKAFGTMKNPNYYEGMIRDLAQHYGLNPEMSNKRLANQFTKVLDIAWKGVQSYLQKLK